MTNSYLLIYAFLCCLIRFESFSFFPIGRIRRVSTSPTFIFKLDKDEYMGDKSSPALQDIVIGLLEDEDLRVASDLAMECFFRPSIVVNQETFSRPEMWMINLVTSISLQFDRMESWLGNYVGFKTRSGKRLIAPNLSISPDSFILTASDRKSGKLVALVEICLEEPSGKLAPPWQTPFKSFPKESYQPYLCNLCVSRSFRNQGIGYYLCELSEKIVLRHWNKTMMYLHVENSNIPALALYNKMNYTRVPIKQSYWESLREPMNNIYFFGKCLDEMNSNNTNHTKIESLATKNDEILGYIP